MIKVTIGDFKIGPEEKAAVNEVLDSGRISEGKRTREFELEWAKFIGTKFAVATSSGTSAIVAGLTALKHYEGLGVKEGQKIITAPVTYIATSSAIHTSGFEPVYVDIDAKTFGITPENIKIYLESLNDTTQHSIILPVHLMGFACDMDGINKVAKKHGLHTFEDSAQAHGTKYGNKKTGSLSLLSDFSFYIAHNIQAGEMGAITTDDYEIVRLVKKLKANGRLCDCATCTRQTVGCPPKIQKMQEGSGDIDPRFTHDMIGYNFKTMDFQAALGLVQLKKAEWIIQKRQENVKHLNEKLEKYSSLLQLPPFS